MLEVRIKLDRNAVQRLRRKPEEMRRALIPAMEKCMAVAEGTAKREYLSGPGPSKLQRRSGRLRGSITTEVSATPTGVEGALGTNVIYARIHEKGGVIRPKVADALRFMVPGVGWRTAQKVVIPPRPFMRPSVAGNLDRFKGVFADSLIEAFGGR